MYLAEPFTKREDLLYLTVSEISIVAALAEEGREGRR